ncbi:MAG: hypothetical protein P8Z74_10525 [Acidobacteriota bacterium]|jgi:hypothetical protein
MPASEGLVRRRRFLTRVEEHTRSVVSIFIFGSQLQGESVDSSVAFKAVIETTPDDSDDN